MKNKKLILIIIFSLVVALIIFRLVYIQIGYLMQYSNVCQLEYGVDWTYEYDSHVGKTCVKLDYITLEVIDRKGYDLTDRGAKDKYCKTPSYWDFRDWDNSCKEI